MADGYLTLKQKKYISTQYKKEKLKLKLKKITYLKYLVMKIKQKFVKMQIYQGKCEKKFK